MNFHRIHTLLIAAFAGFLFFATTCFECRAALPVSDFEGHSLPDSIFVGGQRHHVQGLALDKQGNCMYMSFTDRFLKIDLKGNIIASIDRIQGHLGAMTFDAVNRKVYASLECKDDVIGRNISKSLNVKQTSREETRFYIAIIDVDKLEGHGMSPENNDVLKTVCLRKVVEDYKFTSDSPQPYSHRYGCSGIDGVTIAPAIEDLKPSAYNSSTKAAKKKNYLYVAYGIYGDVDRKDNDYQVIHVYDLDKLSSMAKPMVFGENHSNGPRKPMKEYFVKTGNTNYGVQNMAYDPYTGCIYMAVYKGKKPEYPNYTLFAFSLGQKPLKAPLEGGRDGKKRLQLSLVRPIAPYFINPQEDSATGITGWRFKWGSTGLCPLGDGLWYISENTKDKVTKEQNCTARLYRWTGKPDGPFVPAKGI